MGYLHCLITLFWFNNKSFEIILLFIENQRHIFQKLCKQFITPEFFFSLNCKIHLLKKKHKNIERQNASLEQSFHLFSFIAFFPSILRRHLLAQISLHQYMYKIL
uniref:Uncharacterized protein n=1 Tax=Proboscia inermis TaxID=420281 RepID=A0A7S0BWD6_9STRA